MIFSEKTNLSIRTVSFTLLILISLFHLSCSESPSSLGKGLVDPIEILVLDSAKDSLYQSSNVYKQVIPLSNADRLLLGKKNNIKAAVLIKFLINFADSIKTQLDNNELIVSSAYVEFTKDYTFGDSIAPLDYSVYKISSNWSTGFTSDSLSLLTYDANDISFNKSFSDSVNSFHLNNDIAFSWLKAFADSDFTSNKGLYIEPSNNSEKIIGFQALSVLDVPIPYLHVVIQKSGVYTDTLNFFPSIDLSVISGSIPDVGVDNIGIQAGLNSAGRLFFDLSKLPKNIVINYAQLTLTLDTLKTITGSSFENSLKINYLTDSTTLAIDSSYSLYLTRSGNTFKGSVTSFIQRNVLDNNNQGLLISAGDRLNGVELFAIKNGIASAYAERPNLQIIYTLKK